MSGTNPKSESRNPKSESAAPAKAAQISAADWERIGFLEELDGADVEVTDWEAQFIEDLITSPRALTPAQRAVVDKMRDTYAGRT